MQRELVLDVEKPIAEALARALEAMIEEARMQARRALGEPADAVHQYRRALRRAEAVLDLSWPMMRKLPRKWLGRSLAHARRRTRIARDLDAVLPVVERLQELELFDSEDPALAALRTWLDGCRGELASDEIVAWRLRKNARALAGLADIFQAAIHSWVDVDLVLDRLRESYRTARKAWRRAADSGKAGDVHALRRVTRTLRYQLELLASARPPKPVEAASPAATGATVEGQAPAAPTPAAPSGAPPERPEPPWLAAIAEAHEAMKSLVKELGSVTDLMALQAMVDEADQEAADFDADRLATILGEITEGRIERALAAAAKAFEVPAKRFLVPASEATPPTEAASPAGTAPLAEAAPPARSASPSGAAPQATSAPAGEAHASSDD